MIDLAVVVLNYNTKSLTLECLKSVFGQKWKTKLSVWVVDNASSDDFVKVIRKRFPQVRLIESKKNLGFSGGNNLALRQIVAKYVLLLNSDTKVSSGSLDKLVDFAQKNNLGITSCKLSSPDGRFQPNAGELPFFLPLFFWLSGLDDILGKVLSVPSYQARDEGYYKNGKTVGWVSGSVMLIRDDVLKSVGFLDDNIFMYGEDVEFCLRTQQAGFKIGWTKETEILHIGGASSNIPKFSQWRGEFLGLLYIYRKHYGFLAALGLRFLMYIFISLRAIIFLILGKLNYTKTYAKIIVNI